MTSDLGAEEKPFCILWGRRGRRGLLEFGEGSLQLELLGSVSAFPRPFSPLLSSSRHPSHKKEVDSNLPGARGVGVGMEEAGGVFLSAEHNYFRPGPDLRGKISLG